MNKHIVFIALLSAFVTGCASSLPSSGDTSATSTTSTSETTSGTSTSDTSSGTPVWDGNSVTYAANDIKSFGSGTPAGVANYDQAKDEVAIWNIDASLDNYGGVQTPRLALDFSKAVIFEMDVVSSYSQYIVKLAVEGENEYYYVLSDEGTPGLISINVVDAMLSTKYRERVTMPDPGYATGWKYANQIKNCAFHVLAKGPDGERQTAELVVKHIAIYNNQPPVTGVTIVSNEISSGKLEKLKNSASVTLSATIAPNTISDQNVIWSSLDGTVASISSEGVVSFIGVGTTTIIAKSRVDQSKTSSLVVNVLSGYENTTTLKTALGALTYGGSNQDVSLFTDLFKTTWGTGINIGASIETMAALDDYRSTNQDIVIENFFNPSLSSHTTEATSRLNGSQAATSLSFSNTTTATVYRNIAGALYQSSYDGTLPVSYATNSPSWAKRGSYVEEGIVVKTSGEVYKYRVRVLDAEMLINHAPSDLMNTSLWTVPDRTRQAEDAVVHALSPASLLIEAGQLVMKQNKYPEAKYCFGGIVSNVMFSADAARVQVILNVTALNQMNAYVKTMWEVKIIYYGANGTSVISSNPLKVASGNIIGQQEISFVPAYSHFRIYLVVNGSDIGAQFADAEIRLDKFKMYTVD